MSVPDLSRAQQYPYVDRAMVVSSRDGRGVALASASETLDTHIDDPD